jgi:hypothetical protein
MVSLSKLRRWVRGIFTEILVPFLRNNQWIIMGLMWFTSMLLGYWGFALYYRGEGMNMSIWDLVYVTLQLFTVESGFVTGENVHWQLELARLMAPATTLYTAIAAFAIIFHERIQLLRLRFLRDHTIICGLGRRGTLLTRSFLDQHKDLVIIEHDSNNEGIDQCRSLGAIVLIGDATEIDILAMARVDHAENLIAVCGSDGINAEIAMDARELVSDRAKYPLKCVVEISDLELVQMLKGQEIAMGRAKGFRLEFFNTYMRGASAMLEERPPFSTGEPQPYILVVGLGRFGQSIVAQASRTWANTQGTSGRKIRFLLVDRDPEDRKRLLILRNPMLRDVAEIETLSLNVQSSAFHEGNFLLDENGGCAITRAYVCLDDDSRALAAGLALLRHLRPCAAPIVVRMVHEGGLARLIEAADGRENGFGTLHSFGFVDRTCDPDLILGGVMEILARAVYQERQAKAARSADPGTIDPSVSWNRLSLEVKKGCRMHADNIAGVLMESGHTIVPLHDLSAGEFQFQDAELATMAESMFDHIREDSRNDPEIFYSLCKILDFDPAWFRAPWKNAPQDLRDRLTSMCARLPRFLAKSGFQVTGIG